LRPDRLIDVRRAHLENFVFGADNIHLSSEPPLDILLNVIDRPGRMKKKHFLQPSSGQFV
jgi:hypothetical protein